MKCPKCDFQQAHFNKICDSCGLVFEKCYKYKKTEASRINSTDEESVNWRDFILPEEDSRPGGEILLKFAFLIFLTCYSFLLIFSGKDSNYAGEAFMHLPNLVFHEAGHVIFGILGQFIGSLGGTLGQFLMPLICFYTFFIKQRNIFSSAIVFWWFAENFVDIAPYINDARAGKLPLVGGNIGKHAPYGFHDWEYLLTETGLIRYDNVISLLSHLFGSLLMITAIIWGALVVYKQYSK